MIERTSADSLPGAESAATAVSGVTWSAIIAGGLTIAAVTIVMLLLGSGLGLTAVSPWSNLSASATTLGAGVIIWLVITQWVAAGLGGYLTGRLRIKRANVHTHEVFFRDTAHGLLAWALATVISATLLASATTSIVSGTSTATTTVLSGVAQGAVQAGNTRTAGALSDWTSYLNDFLFRSDKPLTGNNLQDIRGESGRILARALAEGELPPADKTQLAHLAAAQTGLSEADAEKRVDDVMAQGKTSLEKVKQAAESVRQATATLALFSFLSLLISAFIACVAAAFGGQERDELEEMYTVKGRA